MSPDRFTLRHLSWVIVGIGIFASAPLPVQIHGRGSTGYPRSLRIMRTKLHLFGQIESPNVEEIVWSFDGGDG